MYYYSRNKNRSTLLSPDRQMFQREKKASFPFILFGLFDPEGLDVDNIVKSSSLSKINFKMS
ncbi:hypothetical protein FZC79_14005 [Rossellomorea vietnamensis]|uniref:Uncharacterized protein n=1 Tax=Rossellomorea vietnamensis TaxID=218284 RepID=A0A5D4KD26_9BACI|nr:hypothetical protein FZC79_14005 [Rossellomorea vietnamensis]